MPNLHSDSHRIISRSTDGMFDLGDQATVHRWAYLIYVFSSQHLHISIANTPDETGLMINNLRGLLLHFRVDHIHLLGHTESKAVNVEE